MPAPRPAAKADDRSPATINAKIEEAKKVGPLAVLRVPFAENQIGLLPRAVKKGDTVKFGCHSGTQASADGKFCGGYHARSVHLDFVGHAALTDRLLIADEEWAWDPLGVDDFGLPKFDGFGGLWIRLTVGGVTRLGYGDAQGKDPSSTAVKEIIGDALRNAGMRFGMALDLWHKGDLHDFAEEQGNVGTNAPDGPATPPVSQRTTTATTAEVPGAEVITAVIPGTKEVEFDGVTEDAHGPIPDFLKQAADATNSKEAAAAWQAAKRRFGRSPSKAQTAILDTIAKRGSELVAIEKQGADAAAEAKENAAAAMKRGFEGGENVTPPHKPEDLV